MAPRSVVLPAALLGVCLALPCLGQGEYTGPGELGTQPKSKEEIEQEMEDARWRLGPVRLAPWLGLRGLTYVQNVFAESEDATSDLTANLGAGLTAYLPTGPKVFWLAQAMPEYLYWLDLEGRRQLVGRYGAGVYGDFNRLSLSAAATSVEEQAVVTPEEPQRAISDRQGVAGALALHLTPKISLTAEGSSQELASRPEDDEESDPRVPAFSLLDREERRLRGGVRFRATDKVELETGAEWTETRFDPGARDLSASGTSPYVRLSLAGNKLDATAEIVRRNLDPEPGSELVPVEATQGSLHVAVQPGSRFTIGAYGHRQTVYSLDTDYSHFTDQRLGVELGAPFGHRVTTRLFYETGDHEYAGLTGSEARTDDATAWGATADVELRPWLRYQLGYRSLELDSNLPGFDRETSSVLSTLAVSTSGWAWR